MALFFAELFKINQLLSLGNFLKLYCSSSVPVAFQLCGINECSKIVQKHFLFSGMIERNALPPFWKLVDSFITEQFYFW